MKYKVGNTQAEVTEYVRGTNELLDAIIGDDTVFIVNGSKGRRPVTALTEQEAVDTYVRLYL